MRRFGSVLLVWTAALVCVTTALAQPPGGDRRPGGPGGRRPELVPGRLQDELKLTDDQKKQIADLQKELDAKVEEAHSKLDKILTDDQKKQLQEMRERRGGPGGPGGPGGGPGGDRGGPGGERGPGAGPGGPGGPGGPPRPGQILPGFLQDELKLSGDQKKQVEDLQKDVDSRLDKILTDDQKKELRDFRERRGGPGGGGPGGGRPGDGRGGPGGRSERQQSSW